jgi:hypothetical protein
MRRENIERLLVCDGAEIALLTLPPASVGRLAAALPPGDWWRCHPKPVARPTLASTELAVHRTEQLAL